MIKVRCDFCGEELNEPGALQFSPPDKNGNVQKIHVCIHCWNRHKDNELRQREKDFKNVVEEI